MHPSEQSKMIRIADHLLSMMALDDWTMQQHEHAEWLARCAMVASHRIAEMRRERRDRHNVRSLTGWRPSRAS